MKTTTYDLFILVRDVKFVYHIVVKWVLNTNPAYFHLH